MSKKPPSKARQEYESPVLDQVIRGGSSVSLNLLAKSKPLDQKDRFFSKNTLNGTVVFKYPNFDVNLADLSSFDFGPNSRLSQITKPIETAIFVPYDTERLEEGGDAVYVRQEKFSDLFEHFFGLESKSYKDDPDVHKISLIDECPTLDPFLLQATFRKDQIEIHPNYLEMDLAEETQVKLKIEQKLFPIIGKALGKEIAEGHEGKRFVDAIWDPTRSEAGIFIQAFGLETYEIDQVMTGWKGVSYYQYLFYRNAKDLKMILNWFRSPYSKPVDAGSNATQMERLNMHKGRVFQQLERLIRSVRSVFSEYDDVYSEFLNENDPKALRDFFRTAEQRYWILGFTCSALFHAVNLVKRTTRGDPRNPINYNDLAQLYTRLEATLSSRKPKELPNEKKAKVT